MSYITVSINEDLLTAYDEAFQRVRDIDNDETPISIEAQQLFVQRIRLAQKALDDAAHGVAISASVSRDLQKRRA